MSDGSEAPAPVYGFVGLGQMGGPMAARLSSPIVYDTRKEAMAPLVDNGARAAADLAEVAAGADLISIMVRDDAQVDAVFTAMSGELRPGTVLAVHSTIAPGTAEALAARAEPYGVEVVDAPVSGGFMGAHDGTLAVMVGGSERAFARVEKAFGAWANLVLHMGPVGAGTRTKLARNLLHFVAFTAAAEAQRLAEAAGVSLRRLGRVVRHSDAITGGPGAIMIRPTTAPLDPADPLYDIMCHTRALGEKDLSLALGLATELGVDVPLGRLALERFGPGLGLPEPTTTDGKDTGNTGTGNARDTANSGNTDDTNTADGGTPGTAGTVGTVGGPS